jgi:hypothetical protein
MRLRETGGDEDAAALLAAVVLIERRGDGIETRKSGRQGPNLNK